MPMLLPLIGQFCVVDLSLNCWSLLVTDLPHDEIISYCKTPILHATSDIVKGFRAKTTDVYFIQRLGPQPVHALLSRSAGGKTAAKNLDSYCSQIRLACQDLPAEATELVEHRAVPFGVCFSAVMDLPCWGRNLPYFRQQGAIIRRMAMMSRVFQMLICSNFPRELICQRRVLVYKG